jgi:hypothetical protein
MANIQSRSTKKKLHEKQMKMHHLLNKASPRPGATMHAAFQPNFGDQDRMARS